MSSKQQDYTEYTVDLSQLTKERPLGERVYCAAKTVRIS